jgi:hypothetical protein
MLVAEFMTKIFGAFSVEDSKVIQSLEQLRIDP